MIALVSNNFRGPFIYMCQYVNSFEHYKHECIYLAAESFMIFASFVSKCYA